MIAFFILFGTRGVTYGMGSGDFHCPVCRSGRSYKHKRVRRFFTLYFIPVLPLDVLGEYVECQQCESTFDQGVLAYDPDSEQEAFEAQYHAAIRTAMVHMMIADGVIDPEEITTIQTVYERLTEGEVLSEAQIRQEATDAQGGGVEMLDAIGELQGSLNDNGKEMVVRAAFLVAASDGDFADEERELLGLIGEALGMTATHVAGVLHEMTED